MTIRFLSIPNNGEGPTKSIETTVVMDPNIIKKLEHSNLSTTHPRRGALIVYTPPSNKNTNPTIVVDRLNDFRWSASVGSKKLRDMAQMTTANIIIQISGILSIPNIPPRASSSSSSSERDKIVGRIDGSDVVWIFEEEGSLSNAYNLEGHSPPSVLTFLSLFHSEVWYSAQMVAPRLSWHQIFVEYSLLLTQNGCWIVLGITF